MRFVPPSAPRSLPFGTTQFNSLHVLPDSWTVEDGYPSLSTKIFLISAELSIATALLNSVWLF